MPRRANVASDRPCDLLFVRLSPEEVERYRRELALTDGATALSTLAEAVAASGDWAELPTASVAVSGPAEPGIGVFGRFDTAQARWIERQLRNLSPSLSRLRYVGWARAERDCERLAAALSRRLGPEALASARFAAVPRGGAVVLAILSYLLDLEPSVLTPSAAGHPLVVVDDCALSGARLRRHLGEIEAVGAVCAHLYSHNDLRAALVAGDPRIADCVAAHDLRDFAPEIFGDRYREWLRQRQRRLPGERLWLGFTEHVCFAWGEPERPLWDPDRRQLRLGWNLLPPSHCLRHRPASGGSRPKLRRRSVGRRGLRLAESVVVGELDGRTVVGKLGSDAVLGLSDSAGPMLDALLAHGETAAAAAALDSRWQIGRDELRRDLERLLGDLLAAGMLVRSGAAPAGVVSSRR